MSSLSKSTASSSSIDTHDTVLAHGVTKLELPARCSGRTLRRFLCRRAWRAASPRARSRERERIDLPCAVAVMFLRSYSDQATDSSRPATPRTRVGTFHDIRSYSWRFRRLSTTEADHNGTGSG